MVGIPFDRIQDKYVKQSGFGCWLWIGSTTQKGYGEIRYFGKLYMAHRITYEYFKGEIPSGLQIDHLCRTRNCVNPDHLEAVTLQENVKRGIVGINSRAKIQCPKFHDYDIIDNRGRRCCSICREDARIKYRMKKNKVGGSLEW